MTFSFASKNGPSNNNNNSSAGFGFSLNQNSNNNNKQNNHNSNAGGFSFGGKNQNQNQTQNRTQTQSQNNTSSNNQTNTNTLTLKKNTFGTSFSNNNNSNNSSNSNPSTTAGNFNFNNNPNQNQNNNNMNLNHSNNNAMAHIQKIAKQYNPQSLDCRFQCILYNKVPKHLLHSFEKPLLVRPQIWDNGVRNNPRPSDLVPVVVYGDQQLLERTHLCLAGHVSANKSYQELNAKVQRLKHEIEGRTKQQILELKQEQTSLSFRLLVILREHTLRRAQAQTANSNASQNNRMALSMIQHNNNTNNNNTSLYQNLSVVNISSGLNMNSHQFLTRGEMQLKKSFEGILKDCRALNRTFERINGRMADMGMAADHSQEQTKNKSKKPSSTVMVTSDRYAQMNALPTNESMDNIQSFLAKQQSFLKHLISTVKQDCQHLRVIESGMSDYCYKRPPPPTIMNGNNNNHHHHNNKQQNVTANQSVFFVGKYLNGSAVGNCGSNINVSSIC